MLKYIIIFFFIIIAIFDFILVCGKSIRTIIEEKIAKKKLS